MMGSVVVLVNVSLIVALLAEDPASLIPATAARLQLNEVPAVALAAV